MITKSSLVRASLAAGLLSSVLFVISYFEVIPLNNTRIWHALLINFLFFTSTSAGMIVWPAIVLICNGKWMGILEKICWTGVSFSIPSIITLILLWIGSKYWITWNDSNGNSLWLNSTFLFSRNIVGLLIFWLTAYFFLANRYGQKNKIFAGWLILIYAITFSLMGFDFIMTLDPRWYSMMIGGYFFISGLYIAAAAWILLSVLMVKAIDSQALHDIGNLAITFCMLTSYLMFSQLLPIWYENLPDETTFLVARMNLPWRNISYILLGIVYLGPILFLLNRRIKQNVFLMGLISILIIMGMWMERWWLVSAVFEKNFILFGWTEILITIVFLGIMTTGIFSAWPTYKSFDTS